MSEHQITIATRESPLAIKQTEWVRDRLLECFPQLDIKLLGMTTQADKMVNISLEKLGGKGWFVKELEEALYDGRADMAVHSMKDVPMDLPSGLTIPVICEREDPRDAFVSNQFASLATMPAGAVLGTSSLRRQTQIKKFRPDLNMLSLRGNVNTRLQRLDEGQFAGIVLAAAGLKRLSFEKRINEYLAPGICLPAAGQGALGIECRADNSNIINLINPLNHVETHACVLAERAVCKRLQGGCTVPIGAYATLFGNQLTLNGLIANGSGTHVLYAEASDHIKNALAIGARVAESLIEQGAEDILRAFRGQ